MRRTLTRMLRRGGHEVIEAKDGQEGMRLFRTDDPDVVVTDIFMPQKEGIETILNLRRENPTLPILAISGVAGRSKFYLDLAHKLGANRTFAKPFRTADLLQEINKLLLR
jgi:CheY-like chemotaxis protein